MRQIADGAYEVEANPVDIDFLAWSCEFSEPMHMERDMLSLVYPNGGSIHLALREGILIVEQQGNGGDYCGASGSLGGAYFPADPAPKRPAELDGGPIP